MGERKFLNKYYSPDLDPSKLPRARRPKNQQMKVRSMLPMSIRCNACGNYICEGTKFNFRREDVYRRDTYKGIRMRRFYFKYTKCSAEMTIKTDPQNKNYVVESGATINKFEPWRAEDEEVEKEKQKRKSQGILGDAMKSLENRTLDSKREMDILAALDQIEIYEVYTCYDALTKASLPDDSRSKEGPSGSGSRLVKAPSKQSAIIFLLKQKPEKKQEETGLLSLQQNYAESDN
ncbi:hypothetical protein Godav_012878 [Gossypium davidsonii]|uniref:Splicing factor YJU2 n=1 Tax=Gossypium davidsonii TaxID=34287 RepID=A0A7J8REI4_GOSDV|nr:hypothetical protein [Gossypium davidsonii]